MRTTTTAYCDIMLEAEERFDLTNHLRKLEKIRVDRVHINSTQVSFSGYRYRVDGTEGFSRKTLTYNMVVTSAQFKQLENSTVPTSLLMEIISRGVKLQKFIQKMEAS